MLSVKTEKWKQFDSKVKAHLTSVVMNFTWGIHWNGTRIFQLHFSFLVKFKKKTTQISRTKDLVLEKSCPFEQVINLCAIELTLLLKRIFDGRRIRNRLSVPARLLTGMAWIQTCKNNKQRFEKKLWRVVQSASLSLALLEWRKTRCCVQPRDSFTSRHSSQEHAHKILTDLQPEQNRPRGQKAGFEKRPRYSHFAWKQYV